MSSTMAMDNPSYFIMPEESTITNNGFNPFSDNSNVTEQSRDCVDSAVGIRNRHAKSATHKLMTEKSIFDEPNDPYSHNNESKRNFRSLLRSMSASAACSMKNQGILQGLPRPTDIAPPGQVPAFRYSIGKTNNLSNRRNRSTLLQNNQNAKLARNNNEDMFYTMPLPGYSGNGKRRHSIGTYLNGDALASKCVLKITSVPSEVPTMDPPVFFQDNITRPRAFVSETSPRPLQTVTTLLRQDPLPAVNSSKHTPVSTARRKRSRRISNKEMEDIVIIYSAQSTEGHLWYDYLSSCFDKMMSQRARQHYRVSPFTVEEIINDNEAATKSRGLVSNAKLQLVIICPVFLESINQHKDSLVFKNIFKADKALSMLLGVTTQTMEKEVDNLPINFESWQKMEINEQNTTIVENFLSIAVSILSRKNTGKNSNDKAGFSIVPKKIKMGQNRVIALLNDPIGEDDNLTVTVDKKGEILQISSYKKRNPYTLQFDIPDCCLEASMLVWIKIEKNGLSLGSRQIKCESRLRELDQILRASDNPMEFMCQTLGFKTTDRDQLDTWMLSSFQKNIPPHFSLLCSPQTQINNKNNTPSMDEYPTLLHFAARFGLEKLCWQLLECPGGDASCDIRNVRHLTPADLAHSAGFSELSVVLRGYMQMNEFSNMYYYLKNISEETLKSKDHKKNKIEDSSSLEVTTEDIVEVQERPLNIPADKITDPFSDICLKNLEPPKDRSELSVALLPRDKLNEQLYENQPIINTAKPCVDVIQKALENDYLIQPSNIKVETNRNVVTIPNPYTFTPVNTCQQPVFIYSPSEENKPFTPTEIMPSSSYKEKSQSVTKVGQGNTSLTGQDELAEIINDFKNNVFTINEVEKLVMDWRNRNETTQSLKEKQEQLDKMRKEYERLQKKMKDELKRPTPFERVKKLFSKGKTKSIHKTGSSEQASSSSTQRPMSRLSAQSESSSSSGRLSTVSVASLGESVIHSDNDDKKVIDSKALLGAFGDIRSSYVNDDYLIPPPPRPLISDGSTYDFNQLRKAVTAENIVDDFEKIAIQFNQNITETQRVEETNKNKNAHLYMNISPP